MGVASGLVATVRDLSYRRFTEMTSGGIVNRSPGTLPKVRGGDPSDAAHHHGHRGARGRSRRSRRRIRNQGTSSTRAKPGRARGDPGRPDAARASRCYSLNVVRGRSIRRQKAAPLRWLSAKRAR